MPARNGPLMVSTGSSKFSRSADRRRHETCPCLLAPGIKIGARLQAGRLTTLLRWLIGSTSRPRLFGLYA